MIPRHGRPPHGGTRYRRRPGVYAILERAGEVLLTYQDAPHFEFQLPGGGIDPGEPLLRALHREVMEETGWTIVRPRHVGSFRRFTFMPEYDLFAEKVCAIFVARPLLCRGAPAEPDHTAVWVNPVDAVRLVEGDGDRAMLKRYFGL